MGTGGRHLGGCSAVVVPDNESDRPHGCSVFCCGATVLRGLVWGPSYFPSRAEPCAPGAPDWLLPCGGLLSCQVPGGLPSRVDLPTCIRDCRLFHGGAAAGGQVLLPVS